MHSALTPSLLSALTRSVHQGEFTFECGYRLGGTRCCLDGCGERFGFAARIGLPSDRLMHKYAEMDYTGGALGASFVPYVLFKRKSEIQECFMGGPWRAGRPHGTIAVKRPTYILDQFTGSDCSQLPI
jgi:hypothetical protein